MASLPRRQKFIYSTLLEREIYIVYEKAISRVERERERNRERETHLLISTYIGEQRSSVANGDVHACIYIY